MNNQSGATAKTCTYCGCDCSKIKRLKDPEGRYYCVPCHDQHGPAPRQSAHMAAAPLASVGTASESAGDDFFGAALPPEQLDLLIGLEDAPESVVKGPPRVCSNCGRLIGQAIICTSCGFNTQTGKLLTTGKLAEGPKSRKCSKCNYSLAGIETPICPECGHFNRPKDKRDKLREQSRALAIREYTRPLLITAIGLGLASAIYASTGDTGADIAIWFLLKYAISVPVGVVAFFICCLLWMGFDAPLHLTALRLAAVYAVVDAVVAGFSLIGIPILFMPWIVQLIVYAGLLSKFLDLEFADAIFLAIITTFLRVAVFIAIAYALYDMGY